MADRPLDVVAFDVNETLFDIAGLAPRFAKAGLDESLVPLWFARVLRDGFALTVLGNYRPFPELGAAALRNLGPDLSEDAVQQVLAGFAELDPHPDVEPALRALADAGVRAVTLTNGSAANTRTLLDRAGLLPLVADTLSVDAVQRWKPAPEPYRYAASECGVEPGRLALVACHAWDVHGARVAGLRTGYVRRAGEPVYPTTFSPAEVHGEDLTQTVRGLLAG
ncbi:MAG: haloacid dehalogenase type II [Actinomycetota bacterium]|nr:haloacid dehalogenase type II [Actinomycetota bacterium]